MTLDQEALKEELIQSFHLEDVPEDKKEKLLEKMGESLFKRIFIDTMEKLGSANMKEYEAMLDRGAKPEEFEVFFESKIPGYNIFVRGIVTKFKEELAEGAM
ncbi:MAG: hypothetical protein CO143_02000 [Candidatus Moranbacteria bacterium CG_4_9_14_3_um_filter_45_14]|nr:MAG: hypothetical protein CO143_02000 [Candidatus Moranbacteria bacterium CG_4_9_14_3_um_filter_45_14]